MDRKIRIGAVSYLNTKPLLYGLERLPIRKEIALILDYPASIAAMLNQGSLDVGLVPIAVLPQLKGCSILSDYCIGCDGPVASVCLFSDLPLEEIDTVLLDYQSRTSAALLHRLFREHWKLNPIFEHTNDDQFFHRIRGKTAGLIIGDRALAFRHKASYMYDLGQAWKDYTGKGFVFAAWIACNQPSPAFIEHFNEANAFGLLHLDDIIRENPVPDFDLDTYYRKYIQYRLDENKKEGMRLFLEGMLSSDLS